jgi:hypothetical protein|nr:MAG TPA: hypothetical protein [Bacteriophage sp.]
MVKCFFTKILILIIIQMTKIEIMANRLDRFKEQVQLTVPGTSKNIRMHGEIREQEEKVKAYWRKRGLPI